MGKNFNTILSVLCALFLLLPAAKAQDSIRLEVQFIDQSKTIEPTYFPVDQIFTDSFSIKSALRKSIDQLQQERYLEASIDQLTIKDSLAFAKVWIGPAYQWAFLEKGNVSETFLNRAGYQSRFFKDKPFHYSEIKQLIDRLITYAENHGFPFATVELKNLNITGGKVSAKLHLEKNKLFTFSGIKIIGKAKISDRFLVKYLGLEDGTLYSQQKLNQLSARIKELAYIKEARPPTVTFIGDQARVNLFLEQARNSYWDFLVGILPGSNGPNDLDRRTTFVVSFKGDLQNQFGRGEQFYVDFQNLERGVQDLELRTAYPYLFNLPFGADASFELYRRDTLYRDLRTDIGIQYLFEGNNYIRAFWQNFSTALLTVDDDQLLRTRTLPENIDVTTATYGIEYRLQKLDYRFNPQRGFALQLKGGAGIKTIDKNNNIIALSDDSDPNFSFESLYDTLNLKSFQYRLDGHFEYYWPLNILGRSTIKTSAKAGIIISEDDIYRNEQYRLGGNRLLRGFDEESIFATRYSVFTLEYRVLLNLNSYFFLFSDVGYIEDLTVNRTRYDLPYGFGGGITVQTKPGLLGISLAWGGSRGRPLDFRDTKVHLGFVNYF